MYLAARTCDPGHVACSSIPPPQSQSTTWKDSVCSIPRVTERGLLLLLASISSSVLGTSEKLTFFLYICGHKMHNLLIRFESHA